ncbi:MAG: Ig-like domain-containing protein [bacterium]
MALPSFVALLALACGGDAGSPTVVTPGVASVSIAGVPNSLPVGQNAQLTATALNTSQTPVVNPGPVTWSSSAPAIASVDVSGKVTGLVAGSTSISAKVAGVTGTTSLFITPIVARDTISTTPEAFVPNLLTVPLGSTVVFAFGGGIAHNVIFDPTAVGRPTDIQIATNVNTARTFGTRGAFKFDCTVHPGMRGEIDVQ